MKRTPFKPRKTPLKSKGTLGRKSVKKPVKRNSGRSKGIPAWLRAIPESKAHGSGTYQKRLWRVVSDYVRIRDWYKYRVCVATGARIEHWSEGQAGHLKPYSGCNALYKFDVRNIHLQSASSNKWGNRDTWREYERVVISRGYDVEAFEKENQEARASRLYDSEVLEQIKVLLAEMARLPEQPSYYKRAVEKLSTFYS